MIHKFSINFFDPLEFQSIVMSVCLSCFFSRTGGRWKCIAIWGYAWPK